jgi:hypothetical protein
MFIRLVAMETGFEVIMRRVMSSEWKSSAVANPREFDTIYDIISTGRFSSFNDNTRQIDIPPGIFYGHDAMRQGERFRLASAGGQQSPYTGQYEP